MTKQNQVVEEPIIFSFDNQVEIVSYEALNNSLRVREATGKLPRTRPIEAVEFIDDIRKICEKNHIICNLEPIYVDKAGARVITRRDDTFLKGDIRTWLFEKLITRLTIHDDNVDYHPSIAFTYNERGLALAYGTNVRVCQNMSILNSQNYISTWGNEKLTYEHILELVQAWLDKLPQLKEEEYQLLTSMKEIRVDSKTGIDNLVGKMYRSAVRGSYINDDRAPLGINQMSQFVQALEKDNTILAENATVYDLYNLGTSLINPNNNEFVTIWQRNANWGEFIKNEYLLN